MKKGSKSTPGSLREVAPAYALATPPAIRTEVLLTEAEHRYLQAESARRNVPLTEIIRELIENGMHSSDDPWVNNPLLEPTPHDDEGPGDGSINHDFYIYGGSKKYKKVKGKWVIKSQDEP